MLLHKRTILQLRDAILLHKSPLIAGNRPMNGITNKEPEMSKNDKCETPDKNDFEVIKRRPASSFPLGSRQNPYDYVIVGAGTAGSPLARFLSDAFSVLVLEAGEYRGDDPRVRNAFLFGDEKLANDPRYSIARFFDSGGINPGPSGVNVYSEGHMVAGSSGHNGLSACAGTAASYNAWGTFNPQWLYQNLLPVRRYLQLFTPNAVTPPNPVERGFAGPLFITQDDPLPPNPIYPAIATAAQIPLNYLDYNDSTYGEVGVTASQWYRTPGPTPGVGATRSDAQTAFLGPEIVDFSSGDGIGVNGRPLLILTSATALKVIIEGDTAVGVRYFIQNAPDDVREVFARRKVILSAGSIASPQLLQLSGIGPADLLASLGIPVVLANPHVGQHGENHLGPVGLIRQADPPTFVPRADQFFSDISGANITQLNDGVRRAQVYFLPFNSLVPRAILTALGIQDIPAWSFIGFLMDPNNNLIEVKIVSTDPLDQPEILTHYYEDVAPPGGKSDLERAIDMYRMYANISIQLTGTLPLYPPPAHYPAAEYGAFGGTAPDTSLLEMDARDTDLIAAYHLSGTARMGDVVDGNLDVIGINNLAVADMSVAPVIPTCNTAYAAYLIGLVKAKIEGAPTPF